MSWLLIQSEVRIRDNKLVKTIRHENLKKKLNVKQVICSQKIANTCVAYLYYEIYFFLCLLYLYTILVMIWVERWCENIRVCVCKNYDIRLRLLMVAEESRKRQDRVRMMMIRVFKVIQLFSFFLYLFYLSTRFLIMSLKRLFG